MHKLDLRIRNLETRELLYATFESEVDAARWLIDRPRFMQVMGVATHGLPREVYAMLKGIAKALDDDERALADAIDEGDRAAAHEAEAAARREDEAEMAAWREAQKTADPNRPMAIRWDMVDGFAHDDPSDPREIPEAARAAVLAWVRERDGWVADRGMRVGEAIVTVLPGDVPDGEERVLAGGQFFPTPV
jgi:hypothetical protein